MTLFIITLPAIGLSERFGLQRQSARLIQRFRAATAGRLLMAYQMFRVVMGAMGLRLNGHPTFVRPLVYPMALGAAEAGTEVLASTQYRAGESGIGGGGELWEFLRAESVAGSAGDLAGVRGA